MRPNTPRRELPPLYCLAHTLLLVLMLSLTAADPTAPHLPLLVLPPLPYSLPVLDSPTPVLLPIHRVTAPTPSPASSRQGRTLDPCRNPTNSTITNCLAPRSCLSITRGSRGAPCHLSPLFAACVCLPPSPHPCPCRTPGETCAISFFDQRPACASSKAVRVLPFLAPFRTPPPPPTFAPSPGAKKSLTLDPCAEDADCAGVRRCLFIASFLQSATRACSSDADEPCVCLSLVTPLCFVHTDCEEGERCAETPFIDVLPDAAAMCVSAGAGDVPGVRLIPDNPRAAGLTLESCSTSRDCAGERLCVLFGIGQMDVACSSFRPRPCICAPSRPPFCESSEECAVGEVCAYTKMSPRSLCVAKRVEARFKRIQAVDP